MHVDNHVTPSPCSDIHLLDALKKWEKESKINV
jgi:hypothetical protein